MKLININDKKVGVIIWVIIYIAGICLTYNTPAWEAGPGDSQECKQC